MRISNNQQQTSFKQNIILRLPEGMRSSSPVITSIAEQTGQIAKDCAELVVPIKEGFVLVSDRSTVSGQLLSNICNHVRRLVENLGESHPLVREVDDFLNASCEIVKKEVLSAKAVFDSVGKPVEF